MCFYSHNIQPHRFIFTFCILRTIYTKTTCDKQTDICIIYIIQCQHKHSTQNSLLYVSSNPTHTEGIFSLHDATKYYYLQCKPHRRKKNMTLNFKIHTSKIQLTNFSRVEITLFAVSQVPQRILPPPPPHPAACICPPPPCGQVTLSVSPPPPIRVISPPF